MLAPAGAVTGDDGLWPECDPYASGRLGLSARHSMHWEACGNPDGVPIVFLHGGPGLGIDDGGYDLEPLAATGHPLLMLNQRGAGRSEVITDASRLGIDAYVRDVEALRTHFGLNRIALIDLAVFSIFPHPK